MYEIEKELWKKYDLIAGVDEAGRGPLAGPVVAAAVILEKGTYIEGVTDSKKLSEKKREELFPVIKEKALAYGIAFADEKVIDEINIRNATFLAMNEAIKKLSKKPQFVLIDGNAMKDLELPYECVVKGDLKCASIAAASVLAKVSRDRYMREISNKYPEYMFDRHKGYGTKLHYEIIKKHGILPIHRRTFLKNLNEK